MFEKTGGDAPESTLYEVGDVVTYSCLNATAMSAKSSDTKTCNEQFLWEPLGSVICEGEYRAFIDLITNKDC